MKILPFDGSYLETITHTPGKLRMALSTGLWGCQDSADPQVVARIRHVAQTFEDLGHTVEEVDDEAICDFNIARKTFMEYWACSAGEIRFTAEEMGIPQEDLCNYLDPITFKHLELADHSNKSDLWRVAFVNPLITRSFGRFFEKYDALLTPTSAIQVPKAGGPYSLLNNEKSIQDWLERVFSAARYTYPANETGLPAISIPAGLDETGLPIGAQLYGNFLREDLLLQLASQVEQAKPEWFNQIPLHHISKVT